MGSKYDHMAIFDEHGKMLHRMTSAERAKIFIPFDPLPGFREALQAKEREAEQRDDKLHGENPFS